MLIENQEIFPAGLTAPFLWIHFLEKRRCFIDEAPPVQIHQHRIPGKVRRYRLKLLGRNFPVRHRMAVKRRHVSRGSGAERQCYRQSITRAFSKAAQVEVTGPLRPQILRKKPPASLETTGCEYQ